MLQEARIAFFRAAQTYRFSDNVTFGLYARVCVRNALITRYRKEMGSVILCSLDDHIDTLLASAVEEPFATLSAEESVEGMYRRSAAILSEYERRVFDLYLEGESTACIAERLGKTEKSVYNATARMLAKLRAEFGH
jgi:RNA polymerase sporulation-specific sigma factor